MARPRVVPFLLGLLLALPAHADITIGVAGPLTGSYAVFGEQMQRGAEQAVADINAKGGILGQKVILREFDDACDPKQAVTVANQMASSGIKFVVGHYCSGSTIPASKIYNDENMLMITPASTNPVITEQGFPAVFRVSGRSEQLGDVLGHYIAAHYPHEKIAIVQDQSSYGKAMADAVKEKLNREGVQEVLYDAYAPGQRDYSALVSRLKQMGVQVLFVGGYHTETGLIARQMKEQNAHIQIVGGNALIAPEFWSIAGSAGEGLIMSFGPDPRDNPAAKGPVAAIRKSGFEPEGYTLYTYAAFQAIDEAIRRAGSADPVRAAAALHAAPVDTVFGPLRFDAKGDLIGFVFHMYAWHGGKYGEIPN